MFSSFPTFTTAAWLVILTNVAVVHAEGHEQQSTTDFETHNMNNNNNIARRAIVGGEDAAAGQYPFFAFNKYGANRGCGATLIYEDVLLTTADCRVVFEQRGAYINAMSLDDDDGVLDGQFVEDAGVLVHPNHLVGNDINNGNVMLVKLKTPVSSSSSITPVELNEHSHEPFDNDETWVVGFGNQEQGENVLAENLQHAEMHVVSTQDCEQAYDGLTDINEEYDLCAIKYGTTTEENDGGADSCGSDSGGPLLKDDGIQYGIVSFGKGCNKGLPGVYIRVSQYKDWIRDGICKISNNPPDDCNLQEGPTITFSNFLAFDTTSDKVPNNNQVEQAVDATLTHFKECYQAKYVERLAKLEADDHPFVDTGAVGLRHQTNGNQYNIYLEFPEMHATLYEGASNVPTTDELVKLFGDCITEEYIIEDLLTLPGGNAFADTTEVEFKAPIPDHAVID